MAKVVVWLALTQTTQTKQPTNQRGPISKQSSSRADPTLSLDSIAMEASLFSSILTAPTSNALFRTNFTDPTTKSSTLNLTCRANHSRLIRSRSLQVRKVAGVEEFSAAADAAPAGFTWQIVVGALAGATPFVVAGIEFSKRIIAQRTCDVCGGSGLVLKKENYVRCPGCGGFLPWQSWKRFFTG